ncbi:MAG: hypothetical protein GYB21_07450 [Oceanospirillales bacterium]|nr:hypothetical protein [Oceanospirillales bacterium]
MRLTRTLQALKRARQLRPCLLFHDRAIGGIDVPASDFERVLGFVRCLVKAAEAEGFDIEVNHWGALFMTPPDSPAAFELSVRLTSPALPIDALVTRVKAAGFCQLSGDSEGLGLCVGFQAYRPGTKAVWRTLSKPEEDVELAQQLVKQMMERIGQLAPRVRLALPDWHKVSLSDVLCVLRYGAYASHGQPLEHVCYPKIELWAIERCVIECDNATLFQGRYQNSHYRLAKAEHALLARLIPDLTDDPVEFTRHVAR